MYQKEDFLHSQQRRQIEETLRRLISDHIEAGIKPEDIRLDSPLIEQGLDSFQFMYLLVEMEDVFGIKMTDEDLMTRRLNTLSDLVDTVESVQKGI